jgi:phosphoglycolate phosphatase
VAAGDRPRTRPDALDRVVTVAVLFDLDGVLIDSRTAIVRCIEHALAVHGVRPQGDLERFIGPPLIDDFAELAGPERAPACLATYRERYARSSLVETVAAPGALDALAAVAARVPAAVATSKPAAYAIPLCEQLGFATHLHAIAGPALGEPSEVKAATVRRALGALGLAPGAAAPLVGDRRHDVEAAHANRLACVGVLWGIGDEAELRAAGADAIVRAPDELLGALSLA